jgi:hypothetical protein
MPEGRVVESLDPKSTYSLQRIEGQIVLERSKLELSEDLSPGDGVSIFITPAGKYILNKSENPDLVIERINSGFISFERDLVLREE